MYRSRSIVVAEMASDITSPSYIIMAYRGYGPPPPPYNIYISQRNYFNMVAALGEKRSIYCAIILVQGLDGCLYARVLSLRLHPLPLPYIAGELTSAG